MNIKQQLKTLPRKPGIYQFKDAKGNLLYVGKAKVLANRVRSYFSKSSKISKSSQPVPAKDLDHAKAQMVPQIANIETIATDTETEALVLEANLIRQHQPPYNVVLRDDKYYLFIKITTNEEFPRVFPVRRVKRDRSRYFGPYSSAHAVRATLRLLRRLFPHKGEKDSPREKVFPHPLFAASYPSASPSSAPPLRKGRKKDRHTPSPTTPFSPLRRGRARAERGEGVDYQQNIANIIKFLQGHRDEITQTLRAGMQEASRAHEFERAAIFRNQLQAIERLEGTQKVFLPSKESFDVVSQARSGNKSAANVFQIRDGKLLGKNTFLLKHRAITPTKDILRQFMLQYYSVAQDIPKIIFIPELLSDQDAIINFLNTRCSTPGVWNQMLKVPQRGKKRQLMKMGELNAQQLLVQEEANFASEARLKDALEELFRAIGVAPASTAGPLKWRVETYDISNIQGQLATASMVVFENGKPAPKEYRKFKLKLTGQPNDFAMLQEALRRRFSGRHPEWKTPDLIIIDGGKGQLSAAQTILKELNLEIPTISLAKRLEEIFIYPRSTPSSRSRGEPGRRISHFKAIRLPYNSDALYLIQRMRDEAHRFTITYHKLLRSRRATRSIFDDIPGIGPKTKRQLLRYFGSLKGIRAASAKELEKVLGKKKAATLRDYL